MKRFNWLSDAVVPLLMAILRVAWLVPWLELLRRWVSASTPSPLLPFVLILAFLVTSMIVARLLAMVPSLGLARLAAALLGFAAILGALWWQFYHTQYSIWNWQWLQAMGRLMIGWENELPAVLIAVPVFVYLWLRGTLDGQHTLGREDTWGAFISGFLALALCAVLSAADGGGLPAGMGTLVFFYFATGMAALALASLETAQEAGIRRQEGRLSVNRYWLASVASVIIGLLLIGLLLSILISPDVIARAMSWTSFILEILGQVLYYVILVLAYIIFSVLEPLLNALHSGRSSEPTNQQIPGQDLAQQMQELQHGTLKIPPAIDILLPWLGLALLLLIVAAVFALALRRFWRRSSEDAGETRETILSRALLARQLSDLWRSRFGGMKNGSELLLNPFLSLDGEAEPRRVIRQIYQGILAAMKERGHPREPGQTPAEYQRTLESILPDDQAALKTMTGAYMEARYADRPPAGRSVDAARRAWEKLKTSLARDDAARGRRL